MKKKSNNRNRNIINIKNELPFKNVLPFSNLSYPTLLSLDSGTSYGSGFRLKHNGYNFLVTAKHVLYDAAKLRCERLIITCQSADTEDPDAHILEIDMTQAKCAFSTTDDVAIVLLGTNKHLEEKNTPLRYDTSAHKRPAYLYFEEYVTVTKSGGKYVSSVDSEATRPLSEIRIANDVYLSGYPMSLGLKKENFFDYSKPLLRKGIIAGVNIKENTFVVDCPAYYGNSGGVIIEHGEDNYYRVIGLVSRYIPFVIEWRNSREPISHQEYANSGYSVCVPMNAILSLVNSNFPASGI